MSLLIKNATIINPKSKRHNTKKDILIKNGIIEKIASTIKDDKSRTVTSNNLHVSLGWYDIGALNCEPGFEHRESLESLANAAAAGGYTGLSMFPNTYPVVDNKASLQYILNSNISHVVDFYPIGALSKNCQGQEITEMMDMSNHGAIAFSDGSKNIDSSALFLRALEYVKSIDGLIIHHPTDKSLSNGNSIHEGEVSTTLGIKASPSISELLTLERDILLNDYADSKLLCHNLSTKESVAKVTLLKRKNIFSSVAYLNLCKTDVSLQSFDVNYKVSPPLRTDEDRMALIQGINKGKINIISSNHHPLEEEAKKKEFMYAEAGAIGLQTCFAAINTFAKDLKIQNFIKAVAINPRQILNIDTPEIEVGQVANLTFFDPDSSWEMNAKTNYSKSINSPFWNQSLVGKVIGVVNGKKSHFNNY